MLTCYVDPLAFPYGSHEILMGPVEFSSRGILVARPNFVSAYLET